MNHFVIKIFNGFVAVLGQDNPVFIFQVYFQNLAYFSSSSAIKMVYLSEPISLYIPLSFHHV